MMTSTKPQVHNVLHCRQTRTKPQPQVTCAENFVKFGHVVFEICERTDIDRNKEGHKDHNTSHTPGGKVMIK